MLKTIQDFMGSSYGNCLLVLLAIGVMMFFVYILFCSISPAFENFTEKNFLSYCSPNYIYKETELNYVSCVLLGIILFATNYLFFTITFTCKFINWATHVGRRKW